MFQIRVFVELVEHATRDQPLQCALVQHARTLKHEAQTAHAHCHMMPSVGIIDLADVDVLYFPEFIRSCVLQPTVAMVRNFQSHKTRIYTYDILGDSVVFKSDTDITTELSHVTLSTSTGSTDDNDDDDDVSMIDLRDIN